MLTTMLWASLMWSSMSNAEDQGGDYMQLEEGDVAPPGWSTIEWRLDRPQMKVATVLGKSYATSSTGATASATSYQDLCMVPCTLAIKPGVRTFTAYAGGATPASLQLDLRKGSQHVIRGESGDLMRYSVGRYGAVLGASAIFTGFVVAGLAYQTDLLTGEKAWDRDDLALGGALGAVGTLVAVPTLILMNRNRSTLTEVKD